MTGRRRRTRRRRDTTYFVSIWSVVVSLWFTGNEAGIVVIAWAAAALIIGLLLAAAINAVLQPRRHQHRQLTLVDLERERLANGGYAQPGWWGVREEEWGA